MAGEVRTETGLISPASRRQFPAKEDITLYQRELVRYLRSGYFQVPGVLMSVRLAGSYPSGIG